MTDEYRRGWEDARLAWQAQGSVPPIPAKHAEPEPAPFGPVPAPEPVKPKPRRVRKKTEEV